MGGSTRLGLLGLDLTIMIARLIMLMLLLLLLTERLVGLVGIVNIVLHRITAMRAW